MGASGWIVRVVWEGSAAVALERAQRELLDSDECPRVEPTLVEFLSDIAETMPELGVTPEDIREVADRMTSDRRPASAEDSRFLFAEVLGTGTVLDVEAIDERPRPYSETFGGYACIASPLPDAELVEVFDTTTPAPAVVAEHCFSRVLTRGDARYVVHAASDTPTVTFFGVSGD